MRVSYCSTCKGRLWQLKRTLNPNLEALKNIDAEWIILDVNCPNDVANILKDLPYAQEALSNGKLKVYRVDTEIQWSIPLAKNLAHTLGTGDILFNLDIDNFIGNSFAQIDALQDEQFIWSATGNGVNGTMGRLGVPREAFWDIGGYNQDLFGAGADDINLAFRLKRMGFEHVRENNIILPVVNSKNQTVEYLPNNENYIHYYKDAMMKHKTQMLGIDMRSNPQGIGVVDDVDIKQHLVRVR